MIVGVKFKKVVESNPGITDVIGATTGMAVGAVASLGTGAVGGVSNALNSVNVFNWAQKEEQDTNKMAGLAI